MTPWGTNTRNWTGWTVGVFELGVSLLEKDTYRWSIRIGQEKLVDGICNSQQAGKDKAELWVWRQIQTLTKTLRISL